VTVVPVNTVAAFVQLISLDRYDTARHDKTDHGGDQYTQMHGAPF
jgi:hypothetical protein